MMVVGYSIEDRASRDAANESGIENREQQKFHPFIHPLYIQGYTE